MRSRAPFWAAALVIGGLVSPGGGFGAEPQAANDPMPPVPEAARWDEVEGNAERLNALVESSGALGAYRREDGVLVVVMPASKAGAFDIESAKAIGQEVAIDVGSVDTSDLDAIKARLRSVAWTPASGVAAPIAVYDAKRDRVLVFSDAPAEKFSELTSTYGSRIEFRGPATSTSRMADYEAHWGGARMVSPQYSGAWCTSGFSVNNVNGNPRMITAGHCWKKDWTVNSPQGTTFGTVMNRSSYPTVDAEMVGGSGISQGASIYVGGATGSEREVYTAVEPTWGYDYCFSGATTYENCTQYMLDSDAEVCVTDNFGSYGCRAHTMVFISDVGRGACRGDSGSPFYSYAPSGDVAIRGLVILGEAYGNDQALCNAEAQVTWIEKWTAIRDAYNVTIKTN